MLRSLDLNYVSGNLLPLNKTMLPIFNFTFWTLELKFSQIKTMNAKNTFLNSFKQHSSLLNLKVHK